MLSRPAPTSLCPGSYFPKTTTRLNSCPLSPPPTQQPSPPKARARSTVSPGPQSPVLSFLSQHSQPLLCPHSQRQSLHTMALCASPPPADPTRAYCARDPVAVGLAHVLWTLDTDCPLPLVTLLSTVSQCELPRQYSYHHQSLGSISPEAQPY